MIYVCRWCGEGSENNHRYGSASEVADAHRYCSSALAVLSSDEETAEDLLLVAEHRELSRQAVSDGG